MPLFELIGLPRQIMDVAQAIRTKRSVRTFLNKPLTEDVVVAILNAGRLAQSSKNEQAWQFIAVQNRATLQALAKCGEWAGHLAGAALAVAILTPEPTAKFQTMFDAGQAAAYMQLAAWERGVGSCPASIYDVDTARSILGYPPDFHLRIAISFGYPADMQAVPVAPRKNGRRRLVDIVHQERW